MFLYDYKTFISTGLKFMINFTIIVFCLTLQHFCIAISEQQLLLECFSVCPVSVLPVRRN